MRIRYCLSCYGTDAYVFSIPVRASEAWLKKFLGRKHLINAIPLRRRQVEALRARLPRDIEVGWHKGLEFFLEGRS
jgi:hypothetical protein